MNNNIGLIISENPISRSYINILKKNNFKIKYLIYLSKPKFYFKIISARIDFIKKNSFAINFLKNDDILNLTNQIENYFNFEKNFCLKMYNFNNIFEIGGKIHFISDENINSLKLIEFFKKIPKTTFINTGNQILKDILNTGHEFVHIHSAYLPNIKGADGSLWQIKKYGNIGVSTFYMNRGIDTGNLIFREKLEAPKFKLRNYKKYSTIDLYRIWFSFFDPLLRGYQFQKYVKENFNFEKFTYQKNDDESSEYFSFMDDDYKRDIFNGIFEENY